MNPLFRDLPTTIFEHMSGLAREHGAVNLGQGFPDFGWPDDVIDAAARALAHGSNQYPPMRGTHELREAICDHYRRHQALDLAVDQVTVTSGATEALAASLLALIEPGDEVLIIEPAYDAYLPMVRRAGGVPRRVSLRPPDWRITPELIAQGFTDRTRLVLFNNPHNPLTRAFDREELTLLAEACVRHGAVAVSDEVWEHVVFDSRAHTPLSSLPGMAERTVKVGSAGKIFSMTGWKVGWTIACESLTRAVANAHQFLTFTTPPNLQAGVAFGLRKTDDYFGGMRAEFASARDYLVGGLRAAGYAPMPVEGTYFVCVDLRESGLDVDDVTFCEHAVREAGVAAIPISSFYAGDPVRHVLRLCFAKKRETIDAGIERLAKARMAFVR